MALILSSMFLYLVVASLVIVGWATVSTLVQYRRLAHIKGPPGAGWSNWWLIRTVSGGRAHLDFYDACRMYGMLLSLSLARMYSRSADGAGSSPTLL
jgi:hypothetical protein